jgi:hypothetical protein
MYMPPDYWAYHLATGCPVGRSKEVLSEMTPALRQRVLQAIKLQGDARLLVDPIEQDPLTATKIQEAKAEATRIADQSGITGKGRCHFVWSSQAQILADRHGIQWFSPRHMNPDVCFD